MKRALASLMLLLAAPLLLGARLVVVMDGQSRPFLDAASSAEAAAGTPAERFSVSDATLTARTRTAAADETWLALGPKSAALLAQVTAPKARGAALLRTSEIPAGVAGVSLEVPVERQAVWIKTAFVGRRRVVVVRNPSGGTVDDAALQNAARAAGLTLHLADARTPGEVVPAMEDALRRSSDPAVVWLLPDNTAITADSVAPLITEALARRIPVVGFSTYFLRVGAVAAVSVDYGACAGQAVTAAKANQPGRWAPNQARLVVDGALAARLGVTVQAGPGVELK